MFTMQIPTQKIYFDPMNKKTSATMETIKKINILNN